MRKVLLRTLLALFLTGTVATAMDYPEFNRLQWEANQGNTQAMLDLGTVYLGGNDFIPRNDSHAFSYFMQAAQAGSPEGARTVGQSYMNGWGVPVDNNQARIWLEHAAQMGEPRANELLEHLNAPPEPEYQPSPFPPQPHIGPHIPRGPGPVLGW